MKQVSGRELARVLQQRGWVLARAHGSHHIFTMTGRRERIVIPIQSSTENRFAAIAHEDRKLKGRGCLIHVAVNRTMNKHRLFNPVLALIRNTASDHSPNSIMDSHFRITPSSRARFLGSTLPAIIELRYRSTM